MNIANFMGYSLITVRWIVYKLGKLMASVELFA